MPIYAYRCSACGQQEDVLQKMSAPPLVKCPACGADAMVKQVTAAGFQLKGSGWYVTDFRDQDKAPAAKNDGESKHEKGAEGGAEGGEKNQSSDSSQAVDASQASTNDASAKSSQAAASQQSNGQQSNQPAVKQKTESNTAASCSRLDSGKNKSNVNQSANSINK